MVAFLAALPAIFAAIKGATEVFDLGKKVAEEIKGVPIGAKTSEGLIEEVESLTPEQKTGFVERMRGELALYEAMSARLSQQGGQIDASTLEAIPAVQRGEIAHMRMTTRPWAVRWMVIAMVFPPLATVAANLLISGYNVLNDAFSLSTQSISHINFGDVLNELYLSMVGWAAGVIMTYMGMREVGKAVGQRDGVTVSDITGSLQGLFGSVKRAFQ